MFDVLSRGFKNATLALQGKARLSEESLSPALREVRTSLLQADVELGVVKAFLAQVKEKSLGEIVPLKVAGQSIKLSPQDWFVKACYDELCELMGPVDTSLDLDGRPAVILMVGLQGSGKTTTSGKIAKMLAGEGKKPLLVAADIYRPAAVDQLQTLGRKIGVPVFHQPDTNPVELARLAVIQARNTGRDVVIVDTAGRLTVDEAMMQEVADIKATVQPKNVLFVVDAMIGQDAVRTAKAFDDRLDFTGFVLTKLDGDARGGAALSIKSVTGKPVKFLGQGEGMDGIEAFRPEGLAQRILGMGDVVGLVQDFEKHVDRQTAEKDAEKLLRGDFGYDDFVKQLQTVRKMGPLREIMARMPMIGGMMDQIPQEALDDRELDRTMAIIGSMTKQERKYPDLLDESRMERIAEGCGRNFDDVEELHERFLQAREMMSMMGRMMSDPAAMQKMLQGGGLPGMPGMPGGPGGPIARPQLSADEKIARRKKQKEARKARKKNR
ncbi:MAG: signal recognition particle protein [Alphaproteobacteria bacterium]|nr:signal recognition particle protein [Alphaproteobacteria bacterium]MCB9697860.1 signal recognition particle protein [Alphaproteobacteria bacterium]